jgi:hypothetical protein
MIRNVHLRAASRGLMVSIAINFGMILAGLVGGTEGSNSFLARFSDLVAAPPGFFILRFCQPHQHTAQSFAFSAIASIAISIGFYSLSVWVFLEFLSWLKSRTEKTSPDL